MPAATGLAAGALGGALAGSLGGAMTGSYGGSTGNGMSVAGNTSSSYGTSASQSYNQYNHVNDAWADSYGYSYSDSYGHGHSQNEGQDWGESQTYGREASAQDVINALLANEQQHEFWREQAEYNKTEAEKSRKWQEEMSNTAYQRAVKDLLSAGLNPILAVGNIGATTPVGATAQSSLSSAYKANAYAEQRASNYGYSKGYSDNYNESHSRSEDRYHSESHGRESGYGWSKSNSYNYGYSEGYERAYNQSQSYYSNNLKGLLGGVGDLFKKIQSGLSMFNDDNRWNTWFQKRYGK